MIKLVKNLLYPQGPVFLVHFVTNKCNANCRHCFIYAKGVPIRYQGKQLSIRQITKAAISLAPTLTSVSLTGGEPFLRDDLNTIVDLYAQKAKVTSINITTNGSHPQKILTSVGKMLESNPKTNFSVAISVDHLGIKHDQNRRFPGLFKRLVKTHNLLRNLKAKKLTVGFNLTVTPQNESDLRVIYGYLIEKLGAKNISLTALRFGPRCLGTDFSLNNYARLNQLINKDFISGKLSGQHGFFGADLFNAKNMLARDFVEQTLKQKRFLAPCQAGRLTAVLSANGDVYPCELLDRKMGALADFDYNFSHLWQSRQAAAVRHFIRNSKCFCTYECFLGVNFLVNPKTYPKILANYLRIKCKRS